MRCEHTTRSHILGLRQCKRPATTGFNLCCSHSHTRKYYIGFTWQKMAGDHWTQKQKAYWPILFPSRLAAERHLESVNIFKNMTTHRRKLTACVEATKQVFPVSALRRV